MPFPATNYSDPYYSDASSPFGWVRHQAEGRGIRVKVREDLERPGYASPDGRTTYARPGLSFPTYHWLIACSVVVNIFGPDVAPDLEIGDPPFIGGGLVLPFQRRLSGPIAGGMPR